jgi:hypothetical protein
MEENGYPDGREMLGVLQRSLSEEVESLKRVVRDPNSDCISRDLRLERIRAYEHVLAITRNMEIWEW